MPSRLLPALLLLLPSVAAAQDNERPLPVRMPQIQTPEARPQPAAPAVKVVPVAAPSGVRPSAAPKAAPARTVTPKATAPLPGRVVPSGVRPAAVKAPAVAARPANVMVSVRPIPFAPVQVNVAQVRQVLGGQIGSGQAIVVRPRSVVSAPFNPLNLPPLALALEW